MKYLKYMAAAIAIFTLQNASAFSVELPEKVRQEIERNSLQAAERYAESAGKPVPKPVDYRYGMKLDVAKVIYMTPTVNHCGNVNKLMTYEDSLGELYTVRYVSQGQCLNNR
ncbi:DUF2790 domain-containing protein [Pseudomonas sp. No.21]|uniref:DUF2790 domain-containing protein n=1 Tax=Pseudomonadaceae TaxID=135621 RepID=UPI001F1E38AA|nr:DUF2790 domain-containing protein [Pseudomonas tohonis]GJN46751.1 hypothetical protein TUM20249_27370 [Pseudomonas tohonis]